LQKLTRHHDWEIRLDRYLIAAGKRSFEWGQFDCILFSLGGAEAMTGIDAASAIRGRYSTSLGAAKHMRRLYKAANLDHACAAFAAEWAGEEISPLMAQRGDIALADVPAASLGLVSLDGRTAVFLQESGIVKLPVRQCRRAWRVG
jgi:hypothetical protein